MKLAIISCILFVALSNCQDAPPLLSALLQLPVLTEMPAKIVYFKQNETVVLPCKGHGNPHPTFTWSKDDHIFDPRGSDNRMVQLFNEGTLVINIPEEKDEGYYQCFAENAHGKAMSLSVKLQPGRLANFMQQSKKIYRKRLGEPLKLPCIPPTSIPKAKVTWIIDPEYGNVQEVKYDNHVTIDRDGNLLFLSLRITDRSDKSAYRCMVTNTFMRENRVGSEHVIEFTNFSSTRETPMQLMFHSELELEATLGEPLRMKCVYGGYPIPTIQWIKTNGKIPETRSLVDTFGMELVIPELRWEDEGQYECRASAAESQSLSRTFVVKILSHPVWESKPKDVETTVGENATFVCSGRGKPLLDIRIYMNTKPLTGFRNPRIRTRSGANGNLSWTELSVPNLQKSDTMVLQCNISNIGSSIFTNFHLRVLQAPPTFVKPPLPVAKVAENNSVRLFCQTSGKPDPIISWYKSNRPITGGRYRIQSNGDLIINKTTLSDAGQYRCKAYNRYGNREGSGRLIVRSQTKLVQKPMDVQVTEGHPAKFTCFATTDPLEFANLKILWYKDDLAVLEDNQRMTTNIQDNSLTVTDTMPRDSGRYKCVASNGIDSVSAEAILTVKVAVLEAGATFYISRWIVSICIPISLLHSNVANINL